MLLARAVSTGQLSWPQFMKTEAWQAEDNVKIRVAILLRSKRVTRIYFFQIRLNKALSSRVPRQREVKLLAALSSLPW